MDYSLYNCFMLSKRPTDTRTSSLVCKEERPGGRCGPCTAFELAFVVSAIHDLCPVNEAIGFLDTYPQYSDFSPCCQFVPLASQSPYPIKVYCIANYRPHLNQK